VFSALLAMEALAAGFVYLADVALVANLAAAVTPPPPSPLKRKCTGARKDIDLTLDELTLKAVSHTKGKKFADDCEVNGDWLSEFFEKEGGPAIRTAFDEICTAQGLPLNHEVRLQIDGAGGHGGDAIKEMQVMMKRDFNINLVVQPPNSPESNVLDLGIWRAIQARVDTLGMGHRRDPEVLANTVVDAWNRYDEYFSGDAGFLAVWEKLKDIAEVTLEAKGDNVHDEGRNAGARKRARAVFDAIEAASDAALDAATEDNT